MHGGCWSANNHIPRSCTHLKGNDSVKGAIRTLLRDLPDACFVARFDIASYYKRMRHDVLLDPLRATGARDANVAVVGDYLAIPDTRNTERGMVVSWCSTSGTWTTWCCWRRPAGSCAGPSRRFTRSCALYTCVYTA